MGKRRSPRIPFRGLVRLMTSFFDSIPLPIAYRPLPLTTMISSNDFRSIFGTVQLSAG